MSEVTPSEKSIDTPLDELRSRADLFERKLTEIQRQSDIRLIRAEMKVEAVRAGIIDLDGLELLDLSAMKLNDRGELDDAPGLIAKFKKIKPWLFASSSSSSSFINAPSAQPPRQKHATEMSNAEYSVARAALLKQRY